MHRIIIGTGLTNEYLSPQHQYSTASRNVGGRAIEKLLGKGRSFGDGALSTFLRSADAAKAAGESIDLVLLRPAAGDAASGLNDFVESIEPLVERATIVETDGDNLPWQHLVRVLTDLSGIDPTSDAVQHSDLQILVVGSLTDQQVLATASFLRIALGCPEVAVCSHLVASSTHEAHLATLRHNLPNSGVRVLLSLEETAQYIGLPAEDVAGFDAHPCSIEPAEAVDNMDLYQRRIVQLLCLHWTGVHLKPLAGGYSGSLLFIANGWKGEARTEPMVLKIDSLQQMRRELDGYHQVKDFFGKHVPTFGYPVTEGEALGVGMDLAAMEGSPETLQETFETAEDEQGVARFMLRLDKALALLSEKLYSNTRERTRVAPYRAFGLHAEAQLKYLRSNTVAISGHLEDENATDADVNGEQLAKIIRLITANEDVIESELCVVHGDLNYANIICDEGDNVWFIDWTHCGLLPIELDFAKLESDVKFVMTKTFDVEDLPRLRVFEEYLLSQPVPANPDELPESLKFAKWDLRYRKILESVRRIRKTCLGLKEGDDWLAYRIALLRYSMHTLSFDKRRQRGECELPQLVHALYSVQILSFDLAADDFHLRIRAERPDSYPPRQRISIDEGPWMLDCPNYDPPYHVDPSVLANDLSKVEGGWAEPEDVADLGEFFAGRPAKNRDKNGRPLNPRGRTGIAGRGLLGLWGPNLSVANIVLRRNRAGELEILLGHEGDETALEPAKGFVQPGEAPEGCAQRVLEAEIGWAPGVVADEVVFEGYTFDSRQTDHAWVESRAYLYLDTEGVTPDFFDPGGRYEEVKWWPLKPETINRIRSGAAFFVREAIRTLGDDGRVDAGTAGDLLSQTG